jgi:hypothetical protein
LTADGRWARIAISKQKMEEKDLGNNRTAYLMAVGRSIVGLAPFVGNVLSEALTISIPGQRLDRIAHFASELDARLKHLAEADLRGRVQKFLPLIEEGFSKAARSATAERRSRIANLVTKGITSTMLSENQLLFLLDVLDQINDAEIIHLGYFIQPNLPAKKAYESKYSEIMQERMVYRGPNQGSAETRQTFQGAYKLHLARVGLLEQRIATTWDGSQKAEGYEITGLGGLLLEYVGLSV